MTQYPMPAAFLGHGLAGLASAVGRVAEVLIEGYAMGSLSMTAYTLGGHCEPGSSTGHDAPPVDGMPEDQTNL